MQRRHDNMLLGAYQSGLLGAISRGTISYGLYIIESIMVLLLVLFGKGQCFYFQATYSWVLYK